MDSQRFLHNEKVLTVSSSALCPLKLSQETSLCLLRTAIASGVNGVYIFCVVQLSQMGPRTSIVKGTLSLGGTFAGSLNLL